MIPLGKWDVSNEDYHADHTAVGHSMIEVARRSLPEYEARFVTHTIKPKLPTSDMVTGSLTHTLVLEPEKYADLYLLAPKCDRRTKAGKERWGLYLAESDGKQVITQEQYELANNMADSVRRHDLAAEYLAEKPGPVEQAVRWESQSGVVCKAKFDKLIVEDFSDSAVVVDLKTTNDSSPEAFRRQAWNYGYHRQAAHYRDGASALTEGRRTNVVFVAVGKSPPYDVVVYLMSGDYLSEGAAEVHWMLKMIHRGMLSHQWHNPWGNITNTLYAPEWTIQQRED